MFFYSGAKTEVNEANKKTVMKLIITDIEATCWDSGYHRWIDQETIELGSVFYDQGKAVSEFTSCIKPIKNPFLSEFCCTLTGIQQEEIDNAQSFSTVYLRWIDWVKSNLPEGDRDHWWSHVEFGSWGDWDTKQLLVDCARWRLSFPFPIDTSVNIKDLFYDRRYKGNKGLQVAYKYVTGHDIVGAHRALIDARATYEVYRYMQDNLFARVNPEGQC